MNSQWPQDWYELTRGVGCEMCNSDRPDEDKHGIRINSTERAIPDEQLHVEAAQLRDVLG